ncbi:PREDICTED: uncharacterized protein LOC105565572 [Vollenhovia emeryi]|uniref:uncharacterized protein LOC105565572 n=1 Tax=Vollenhovia emeryi TaxID=411798 RepID=UPI0005F52F03|nr:PREDICTED: uncharacterized protein LOC105565572 [Vollenhovia emeryi]
MRECRSQPVNVKLWFLLVPSCTSIMLIVNIILFTSGICFATNVVPSTRAFVTSATSTKSKRLVVDPGHNIRNNQEQDTQTTPRIPSPQDINLRSSPRYGNAKATDTPRASYSSKNHGPGSHAYGSVPKRPPPYVSSPVHQIKPEQSQSNLLGPYFGVLNNPDVYKTARSVEKPLDTSKSIVSQSLQKLQGIYSPSYNAFHQDRPIELSGFSDFEYPSYTNINKLISQSVSSSPTIQAPVYKMSYPLAKVTDYANVFAPSIPTVSSITPSSDKITQSLKQKDEATVDVNGKKISVPIIQLQSNLDFSQVLPTFESQPFLLSSNYPVEPDVGFKFGTGPKFNMALQSSNVSPFSSPLSSFQGQVVPIQTANGSPHFPLFKGASVEAYPVASNAPKAPGNYESLYSQPQLHFDKERNGNAQPVNVQQNAAHPSVSTQGILNDVELINKKNPEPHTPQPDDDDDDEHRDDERYKTPVREYDQSSEDDEDERQPGKYFKASPTENDFKPSTSYPFKAYDEIFGKHRVQSDDDDFEDKPFSSYKSHPSSDDDEEDDDSSSEYRGEYTESSKPSHDSYEEESEDEEEEESRKQEKRKKTNERFHETEPKRSKYYQKDFEQEFEKSYREELPKQEYVHVKEVPEIDSYISPSPSKRQQKNNQSRVKYGQPKESKSQESLTSRKNRKVPKTDYKDSTAYSSDIFAKKTPKVIYEEFYGYKKPETKKYSKHAKTEKFSSTKKLPKEDDPYAAKYYKLKSTKTDGGLTSKDSYFSANHWKLNKNSPEKTATKSNARQLSDPGNGASFYEPRVLNGQVRSLTNAEIFRNLKGI